MASNEHKAGGGQPAGSERYEVLRDPVWELVHDLRELGDQLFLERQGVKFIRALPLFDPGFGFLRLRAWAGTSKRKDMPVIDEADLADLKVALMERGFDDICETCEVSPREVYPTQCQIYGDKCIDATSKFGVDASRDFIQNSHWIIDADNRLIDGHHRWGSGCMIDTQMRSKAFRIKYPITELMDMLLGFSDSRHQRNA